MSVMLVQQQDKTTTEVQASNSADAKTQVSLRVFHLQISKALQKAAIFIMPHCLNRETEARCLATVTARSRTEISPRLPELTCAKASWGQ